MSFQGRLVSRAIVLTAAAAVSGCGGLLGIQDPDGHLADDASIDGLQPDRADADAGPPPPDFVWYVLDETSGTTAHDSSPNQYDMGLMGVVWGDGATFDGASVCGFTSVGAEFREPPVTMTAWLSAATRDDESRTTYELNPFPPNAFSGDSTGGGGYGIGLDIWTDGPGSALLFETGDGLSQGFHVKSGAYDAGARYFVALVVDSTSFNAYLNGALLTAGIANLPLESGSIPLYLGCHNTDTNYGSKRFYAGRIRDARIYKRSVGADEIALLYAAGPTLHHP